MSISDGDFSVRFEVYFLKQNHSILDFGLRILDCFDFGLT